MTPARDSTELPPQESERLAALYRYAVLDTQPEAAFDRLARLASQVLQAPIALISFVDADRQWFKARIGTTLETTPRAMSFCNEAIRGDGICMVPDARLDPRFAESPLVTGEACLRFYAGAPLRTPEGHAIGTLCVMDYQPRRPLNEAELQSLTDLGEAVMAQLELRRQLAARDAEASRAALRERLLRSMAEIPTFEGAISAAMAALCEALDSPFCLMFRLARDGRRLQIMGGHGEGPMGRPEHLAALRAMDLTVDSTAAGTSIIEDRQVIIEQLDTKMQARYPGAAFSVPHGMTALIATPATIGAERYSISLGFRTGRQDLASVAERLREATASLLPLLRRRQDTEQAELFRRVVDASEAPVVITDAESDRGQGPTILYVNAAFERMAGYLAAEVVGRSPHFLFHPEAQPAARLAIREAVQARQPIRQEVLNRRRDGSSYWAELNISPVLDETGWCTHWVTVHHDITEQRARTEALSASEAAFRDLFLRHPAPMWVYDKESLAFLEVNDAAVAAYGWTREEFLRMTLRDLRRPEDWGETDAARQSLPGLRITGPWRHQTKAGEARQVQILSRVIDFRSHTAGLAVVWDITERLRAENAVRELAAELDATLESIGDGLYTLDHDWRFTRVNRHAERLLRRDSASLLGHSIWDRFPEATGTELEREYRGAAADRQIRRFVFLYPPLDAWFDVTVYPAPAGLTVYFRDVTTQHQRDERLRLLEVAAAQLNDIITITEAAPLDPPGPPPLFINNAFERLTGFRSETVRGLTPPALQGPRTDRATLDHIHAALAARRPTRTELLNYRKDGEEIWLELDIVPVPDASGRVTHWVSVSRDITHRKRTEQRMQQQAALLDQARDAILVRGIDHRIHYWNRSAERLYGWTAAEALGRTVTDLLYDDVTEFRRATATVLAQGEWRGQIAQRRRDGTRLMVDGAWSLLRDADGGPRAILAVNTDITERLELEQKLRQSQRLEAIGQLTGGVAHDFNNLLTVILGNSEMLSECLEGDADLRQMAEMNMAAAERGAALTSRLLAFSRRQALDPKVIDVNELLAGLQQMLQRTLGEHIETSIAPAPGLWQALIDPPQLESAVLNLCINARDAMPSGGRLVIETANVHLDAAYAKHEGEVSPGEYVRIAVSDTGSGMTPDVVARAFEPFFTTKEVGQGSGLGLSMVFGFMKQSGGHVKIYSEPGHGTAVKMYIPRAGDALTRGAPGSEGETLRGGREKILLVEDDPLVRDHVASQLRDLGYQVMVAENGALALAVLDRDLPFDLLFTDVVMPGGMNGPALAKEAQRRRPGLRVLFTSGYTENGIVHQGRLDPGVLLLNKPYRRRDLAEKVREALDTPPLVSLG
ncbi:MULTISPECIES: PAS domain S-box protein [Roseomonadaceae]|uniref:histidine kinase n=1 Tax=Falsiroseomonas oleicola TaxID=2801474 RepID=A0ABS6HAI6_9PROT|nr:PAS domain S-box protein [Roseomonas oleicola]MBU8545704.1 PAS domain S-box protein [Roseomonas oleicola]